MKNFKLMPIILILVLGLLQYHLWFSKASVFDMLRMEKQVALQKQDNDKLKERNDKLLKQVQYLQGSNEALESQARGELGMVKKGETFYQVVK